MTNVILLAFLGAMIGTTPRDAAKKGTWTHVQTLDLTGSQSQFKDWAAGGEDALAWQFRGKNHSRLSSPRMAWDWNIDVRYGQTQRGKQAFRKTSDEFHFETQLTRKIGLFVDPYMAADVRTQMTSGYSYKPTKTRISELWSPGLTAVSVGGGKDFGPLSVRGGMAAQQKWDRRDKAHRIGLEAVAKVKLPFSDTATFNSNTRMFRPRGSTQWTMRTDAVLRIQVNRFFTVSIAAQVLDQPAVTNKLQFRQVTSIGLGWSG